MSYPSRPAAYPSRPYPSASPITKSDIARCDPPPTWTVEMQEAHERAWAQGHKSSPTQAEQKAAYENALRAEARRMTTAEKWAERFKRGEVK